MTIIGLAVAVIAAVVCFLAGRRIANVGLGRHDDGDADLGSPILMMWLSFGFVYVWTDFIDPVEWSIAVVTCATGAGWLWTRGTSRSV